MVSVRGAAHAAHDDTGAHREAMATAAFWVLLFAAFSIGGWVYETLDNAVRFGGFHWRASFAGPWCPMYGIGGVALTALLQGWAHAPRSGWRKAASVLGTAAGIYVVCTLVEFAAGVFCSMTMGYVPWDYSDSPGNFLGIVAPAFTLKFVVGGLIYLYFVVPPLKRWCLGNVQAAARLAAVFSALLLADFALEAIGVWADVIPRDPVDPDFPRVDLYDAIDEFKGAVAASGRGVAA